MVPRVGTVPTRAAPARAPPAWRACVRSPRLSRPQQAWYTACALRVGRISPWCCVHQEKETATHDTRVRSPILYGSMLCAVVTSFSFSAYRPTVSLGVTSAVTSSCGYKRGEIEQRVAHEW